MKMAVLVYEYPPKIVGGLGTYAAEITRKFVLMEQDVSVFTMNDDEGSLPTRELWRGIEIHRPQHIDVSDSLPDVIAEDVRKWGRGIQMFSKVLVYNYLAASKIINELVAKEGFQYDIVIAHDWLSAIAGITVKRDLGLPLVFHVHSTEKGRTLGNGSEVVSNIEQRAAQMADMIITVSNAMKDELISLGFPKEKIQVSYNGVDPQKYDLSKVKPETIRKVRDLYGVKDDELMILFIGRLVWIKGADKLVLAMPQILKEIPNAKLVIVGLGEMREHIEKSVQSLKLHDHVKFRFEFMPEEERIAHYAACDVAVFPSLYEPFGIVALEAMAMEKPVVVGAAGISGMREIVVANGPNQCGFHINPNDPKDIAWGIINSLKDPKRRAELGKNGRKRVLEQFTWDVVAKNTLDLYQQLLDSVNREKK
ncbi:MAG: glycosyltransferase family 4 protein [Candidatus Bathyarchaeia archaeon]|nr:glycosyltransferase family 4 protein [Candidatus Bathyarchaeota archaeon A05DMB-4]MDH7595250.1 glycosyltransferase family 4 protein [Candidatus Bathyarchaeota archaeon]